jgi:hypothetical protein
VARTGFLWRYFSYRRLYVDAILERAPKRATLAVASEVARLAFMVTGCALVGLIFWLLTASAVGRVNGFGVWPVVFWYLCNRCHRHGPRRRRRHRAGPRRPRTR